MTRHLTRIQPGQLAEFFSQISADYDAAKYSRYKRKRSGIPSMGASGDYHYASEAEFLRMIEYARDYDRNDPIVGQGVTRLIDNVVQDGFKLDPQTGDAAVNRDLVDRWDAWTGDADQCDLAGEHSFHELEKLLPRQLLVDGDVFVLPLKSGQLEIVEAHRCRTPRTKRNVVHGVLLNQNRRRLEYWFTKDEIEPYKSISKVGDMRQYPARDSQGRRSVLHIYNPRRLSQTRGVSVFVPISNTIGMHDDVQFAKLVQQQVVSCFAILRERAPDGGYGTMQTGAQETETLGDGSTRTIEGIAPGMEVAGNPGEQLKGFSPQVPNPEFFQHAMMILTIIGVNVGVPVAVLLLDPSQTNFSGWRGAIDQARFGFRRLQRLLIGRFHSPVYLWKLHQWIAEDAALRSQVGKGDVENIFRHVWHPPTWPYIEPLKDATADLLRVRNGLISPRRLQAERGRDWEEVSTETIEDNANAIRKAKDAAAALNQEYPDDPVHWRELLSLPAAEGVTVSVGSGGGGEGSL